MTSLPPTDPGRDRLSAQRRRRQNARHELALLRGRSDEEILAMARSVPGFGELERIYAFYVERSNPDTLQLSFGNRSMFRPTVDRKGTAVEHGPELVYSLGPTGTFATILYPARSDLARVHEDHLFLRIDVASADSLLRRMRSDIRSMVAYAHVSSIDMTASFGDRWRIWILRQLCHRSEGGKFMKAAGWRTFLGVVASAPARLPRRRSCRSCGRSGLCCSSRS